MMINKEAINYKNVFGDDGEFMYVVLSDVQTNNKITKVFHYSLSLLVWLHTV